MDTPTLEPTMSAPEVAELTRRERQCLLAVWNAGSQREAADLIGINRETLRTHLQTARAKLGARTTLAAIRLVHSCDTKPAQDGVP